MLEHQPVNVHLTTLGPFPVVFPNDFWAVPQDVGHLLERRSLFQQPSREGVTVPVGVSVANTGFLEHRSERSLRDSHYCPAGRVPIPEIEGAVLGGISR